ncbi:reticulon-3 isoform X2 [Cloeon dipterum]|uniref:reticulon-3 isoform X2 n=1 Tax=Cloeon dipterum TaxID=197152 RepID=UPI00321F9F4B
MDPFGDISEEQLAGKQPLGPSKPQPKLDDLLSSAPTAPEQHGDDLLGEILSATASAAPPVAEAINRAATEPILQHDEDEDDEGLMMGSPKRSSAAQPERIQFESGIDLSDIMSKKTDDLHEFKEVQDEQPEQHVPKAKEQLEEVYSAATVQAAKPVEPAEEEMDFRPLPPEPEGHDSEEEEEEPVSQQEAPPAPEPSRPAPEPPKPAAAKPTAHDVEIAACDFSGLFGQLVYWRDPKKSGLVFGGVLLVLLSLSAFSLISVVAYVSLIALGGSIVFRIYKSVLQAVQKTDDGHPFKALLETDITLTEEKVQEVASVAVSHINCTVTELRRLFLVEDLVDSIKFGVLLWVLTYVGAWFNGMTLIILGFIGAFTLPKVYENNQAQIDQYLDIARSKMAEVSNKVKAAIPLGKKDKEQ